MYKRFSAIFTITENPAKVVIPETFATKVKGWLGGNEKLFNNVKDQVCTYFYNNTCISSNPLKLKSLGVLLFCMKYTNNE